MKSGLSYKGKRRKHDTFIMIRHDIYKSEAWNSLSLCARCVHIELTYRYNGKNNGNVPLSCREVSQKFGVSKDTASKAFKELIDRRFIKISVDAAFNVKTKKSRRWLLTNHPDDLNNREIPTNDWREWKN